MINCVKKDAVHNIGRFVVDTVEELEFLPNLTKYGEQELNGMSPVEAGSTAYCTDEGARYILRGETNEWTLIKSAGGGGGGTPSYEFEDVDIDFSNF